GQLDEPTMSKLHRFIRLWRKLDWSLCALDKVCTALGVTEITDRFLADLAQVVWLQRELRLPLQQLLSLWAHIDTEGDDAVYLQLFQNRAVLNPVDNCFALSQPPAAPEVVGHAGCVRTLSAHVPALLAALRISAVELEALRHAMGQESEDAPLDLANVSALY